MSFQEILKTISGLSKEYMIDKPYIVGGLPRDLYLKVQQIKTTDIDITTNSSDVLRLGILLSDKLNVTFDLSDDGHITVFSDEFDIDFSSHFVSAKVKEHLDGKFKGLEEAFSRDFTINTLHQDLDTKEILDPTTFGFDDIKNKLIKTPVPAEITLTDDPRRAYRAVELASRYNFDIDIGIKKFVIDNPDIFKTDKVKDKYVSVKINKALKNNEELTLKLLKDMNLFKNIPLAGYFKDVLIGKKILLDFLDSKNISKKSFIADDWEEYISQGDAYKAVHDFWIKNYNKVDNSANQSYYSWTKWYNDKYNNDWGHIHKSPEETLNIMMDQSSGSYMDMIPGLNESAEFISTNVTKQKNNFFDFFKRKDKDFSGVRIKPGVNVDNVIPEIKELISELGIVAEQMNLPKPIITSGWRSIEQQAKIMGKNWKSNGGMTGGREYLIRIYGKDYGNQMANVFETYGLNNNAMEHAINVIQSRPTGSSHILEPGRAIDVAVTDGIKNIIYKIKESNKFNLSIKDETNTAGPHYHLSISNKVNSNIDSRKIKLRKLSMLINY